MKITFLDRSSFHEGISVRQPNFNHEWVDFDNTSAEKIIEHCADSEIILTNKVPISKAVLQACPNIRHIAVTATGYNIIDLSACAEHGVTVSNTPSYASTSVPEHVGFVFLINRFMT